jgi:CheY-like chemotaxis protein
VSAHVTEADGEKVRQAGFDACLAKPVDLDKMLKMIRRYLHQDEAGRKREE